MAALILAVILEEIVKVEWCVYWTNKIGIQTINDAVKYAILAGLLRFHRKHFYFWGA